MIDIQLELKKIIKKSLNDSFNYECNIERISIDTTPKNFEGFYTFIIFPHIKYLKFNYIWIATKIFGIVTCCSILS